jgi:hypothetical protein
MLVLIGTGVAIPMQFTGLLDKNGKEIYEGDVVKGPQSSLKAVVWLQEYAAFSIQYRRSLEVIGNIYENPELLTPKADETETQPA